jgi:hypothetical protein
MPPKISRWVVSYTFFFEEDNNIERKDRWNEQLGRQFVVGHYRNGKFTSQIPERKETFAFSF